MNTPILEKGTVLLAEPYMLDPNFKRAAVLLCEHGKGGSIGFVMNRPLATQVDELVEGFPEFPAEVFWGGPVQTDTLHYLEVAKGVYWGGDFQQLKLLISQQRVEPTDIRFFLGYAGWGEGQLQEEMRYGSWITTQMRSDFLYFTPPEKIWRHAMRKKGNSYEVLAYLPEEISWN